MAHGVARVYAVHHVVAVFVTGAGTMALFAKAYQDKSNNNK